MNLPERLATAFAYLIVGSSLGFAIAIAGLAVYIGAVHF